MNSRFILFVLFLIPFSLLQAADLVVQESGPGGTYASISAAVTAASDGDRIIIANRPGGQPWLENVTLNKSLTLLSSVNGTRFIVQGDYTISHSAPGKAVRIVGMDNLQGDVKAVSDAPFGGRAQVELAGCKIFGNINFDYNYYDITLAANEIINGNVVLRFGNVYGNDMLDSELRINADGLAGNEVIDVIGNRVNQMYWYSNSHFLRICNNYIVKSGSYGTGIYIDNLKNSPSVVQQINNNSINLGGTNTSYGIRFATITSASAVVDVLNNVVDEFISSSYYVYGIQNSSSSTFTLYVGYNYLFSGFDQELVSITNNGTNIISSSVNVGTNGLPAAYSSDGGHPGKAYYDHDLTRNNPGCYGGSFSMTNYYPLSNSPRVFHVESPRALYQGNTLNITSEGFDH